MGRLHLHNKLMMNSKYWPKASLPRLHFTTQTKQTRKQHRSNHTVRGPYISAATVATHKGMATDGALHFDKGKGPHSDLARTLNLKARLLIKRHQKVLAHEDSAAHVGQAAQMLQVTPHQDGAFALLTEGTVDSQYVDVDGGAVGFVESQRILNRQRRKTKVRLFQ